MPLGSDNSVSQTPNFKTVNNDQPVSQLPGLGESENSGFGSFVKDLGIGGDVKAILNEGLNSKLKNVLGLTKKPITKVITENKTVVEAPKPDDKTVSKVLQTKAEIKRSQTQNNIIYLVGGAGVLVLIFAVFSRGR